MAWLNTSTKLMDMKHLSTILFLILIATATYAQKENPAETTLAKQQKNEQKKADKEAAEAKVEGMIISRQFIFEVSSMNDQSMNYLNTAAWIELSSSLNYIALNSDKLVLQLETNSYQTSNWPFDNFPLNGSTSLYDAQKMKSSDEGYIVKFHTDGRVGIYNVTLNISYNGKADLRMVQNNGVSLKFKGVVVPLSQSRIRPIFI
jgi:hypothetical protein